jgi:hypothetical protein
MKKTIYIAATLCVLMACSEDVMLTGIDKTRMAIALSAEYPVVTLTRATDNGFTDGDQVGIFVVDYENGEAGSMALSGNRASNVQLTYDEQSDKWRAPMALYWAPDGTPADIIGYYPFMESLQSTTAQPITVERDQSTPATTARKGGYERSDLLWAKAGKVSPTAETIVLRYRHVMAGLTIRLEPGDGFTAEEWARLEKTVMVVNTQLNGTFDITAGKVAASAMAPTVSPITALAYGDAWRAVVLPQTVEAGKPLVSVTIEGQSYRLAREESMSYTAGKMHNFTIGVNRRTDSGDFEFTLLEEDIAPWEVDASLHDGLTRAYVTVEVTEPGTLKQVLQQAGQDASAIRNLKVSGRIDRADLLFMGQEMPLLTNLNLQKSVVEDGVLTGFDNQRLLYHLVFPEKGTKTIADFAFRNTKLSGSLVIPEGVETVGQEAFYGCQFSGTLSLPTTLKSIYDGAFGGNGNRFSGAFILPDSVNFVRHEGAEGINPPFLPVFGEYCDNPCQFSGTLNLPSGLRTFTGFRFPNIEGDIIIPQGVKELVSTEDYRAEGGIFSKGGYNGIVSIPEGVTRIGRETFAHTKVRGEVKLPSTLRTMESGVFMDTRISKLIFNDGLLNIGPSCFADCMCLSGTVTWPTKSSRISESVFQNCPMLSGIVIHQGVTAIEARAFERCSNLLSIVCEAEEPPLVGTDAFLGVSKSDCVVEVPAAAVEKYKEAEGWSSFKRIVAHSGLSCLPAAACALNKEHQETLVLYADGAWTVAHQPQWCVLSKASGTGKTEIALTINALPRGAGHRSDSIVFRQTDGGYTTYCKVSQYDYQYEEDACLTLQTHSRGPGIDIVFVGEGFDAAAISDNSYLDLVKYQTECFFAIEPYQSLRNYFNVYVTFPMSQEKGVNTMYTYVNNRFGTRYGQSAISGSALNHIMTDVDDVKDYVLGHTPLQLQGLPKSLVILVPNSTDYGGYTVMEKSGFAMSICPPSENAYPRDTRGTVQHEAGGHGFGKLADETVSKIAFPDNSVKQILQEMLGRGWCQNLSPTGKMSEVPWAQFIFDTRYSDKVDIFEGGYGYSRGIYRPEANSCMNYGIPYYNTPSRFAIWKRVKEYAGESWTVEEFMAQDTFEWGPTEISIKE